MQAESVKPKTGAAKAPPQLQQVKIATRCIADTDTQWKHIQSALKRDLSEFLPLEHTHDQQVVLVGSGPSVAEHIEDVKRHKADGHLIFAIKGAHDYLIDHGVIPHCALMVDPQVKITKCFKRKRKDVIYFIASQCHPGVFRAFEGYPVIRWHLQSKEIMQRMQAVGVQVGMVGGGSTSGLRGMLIAYLMGYREAHLYGFDSCLRGNLEKIRGSNGREDGENVKGGKKGKIMVVTEGQKQFECGKAMASQANEFCDVMNVMPGLKVTAYGDGLIQQVIREVEIKNWIQDEVKAKMESTGLDKKIVSAVEIAFDGALRDKALAAAKEAMTTTLTQGLIQEILPKATQQDGQNPTPQMKTPE